MKTSVENFSSLGIPTLAIEKTWTTPATSYEIQKRGISEIRRSKYARGVYCMEGVDGYACFYVRRAISVTSLFIRDEEWMVDDPLHWVGMTRLGELASGNVLVIGLGLGLVLYSLASNARVRDIHVVERELDVYDLTRSLLPESVRTRCTFELRDFWTLDDVSKYDVVIADIWTSRDNARFNAQVAFAREHLASLGFRGRLFVWGTRKRDLNPAIGELSEFAKTFIETLARSSYERGRYR